MLRELNRSQVGVPISAEFFKAVAVMNAAAHGIEIPEAEATEAERIGLAFLETIREEMD